LAAYFFYTGYQEKHYKPAQKEKLKRRYANIPHAFSFIYIIE